MIPDDDETITLDNEVAIILGHEIIILDDK